MNINKIEQLNKHRKIYDTSSKEFQKYGSVLPYSAQEIIDNFKEGYNYPAKYCPNDENLFSFPLIQTIETEVYGELQIQVGMVSGRNDSLTGIEYHIGSEVNIALTDCILLLGEPKNLQEETIDGEELVSIYVKKGEIIEIYSKVLHYTPIEVDTCGMAMLVILLEGTNTDLEYYHRGNALIKKNKWYVTHKSQKKKIELGYKVALLGEKIVIKS